MAYGPAWCRLLCCGVKTEPGQGSGDWACWALGLIIIKMIGLMTVFTGPRIWASPTQPEVRVLWMKPSRNLTKWQSVIESELRTPCLFCFGPAKPTAATFWQH